MLCVLKEYPCHVGFYKLGTTIFCLTPIYTILLNVNSHDSIHTISGSAMFLFLLVVSQSFHRKSFLGLVVPAYTEYM